MEHKFKTDRYCIDYKSPEGVLAIKEELLARYPEAEDFAVESVMDEYGDGYSVYLFYQRKENDKELAERLRQEEINRKYREDYDRRQYEALKKKFEGEAK